MYRVGRGPPWNFECKAIPIHPNSARKKASIVSPHSRSEPPDPDAQNDNRLAAAQSQSPSPVLPPPLRSSPTRFPVGRCPVAALPPPVCGLLPPAGPGQRDCESEAASPALPCTACAAAPLQPLPASGGPASSLPAGPASSLPRVQCPRPARVPLPACPANLQPSSHYFPDQFKLSNWSQFKI